jgi:hypothetical protein
VSQIAAPPETADTSAARVRPRLSRTFSRSRWPEYRSFLLAARDHGYRISSLEQWVRARDQLEEEGSPLLILRHDVDQHPRSALTMAAIEEEMEVRSSWYFRWRTAHPAVVRDLRDRGFEVGLHYETLTRMALEQGLPGPADEALIESGRRALRNEIAAFARLFGPIRAVVPHGDSRVPAVHNAELLRGQDVAPYGIEFDGNDAMRGWKLGHWLTDRISAEGRWKDGVDPADLFADGVTPILSVIHPNNWASGWSLWVDRIAGALLPSAWDAGREPGRPIRTGSDAPPRLDE